MTETESEPTVAPPPPKVRKTAASKAQEALDVAERKLVSLNARLVKAKADVEILSAQIAAETIERDYFKGHPALATKPEPPTNPEVANAKPPTANEDPFAGIGS